MRIADYIAKLLIENNINDIFTVVGGGAMHLNDAFGNNEDLRCIYNLHEQGAAIAAEGYARVDNKLPVICVTTGPGGTNALTGVLCAWQDSIPMLVISGQVRQIHMVKSTGLNLRQYGEQEHDIINTVKNMTKFAAVINDPTKVRYTIEKAIYLATHGRKGPCWIDIPLDIQGKDIEVDKQVKYTKKDNKQEEYDFTKVIQLLSEAKRPLICIGSGIRSAGAREYFLELMNCLEIPVVAAKSNADLVPLSEELYYGNFGILGGRAGNFIVQNADCILVLGCRLSFAQIGFQNKEFSPKSTKIVVDIDSQELKKENVNIDYPINMDVKDFVKRLLHLNIKLNSNSKWIEYCNKVREQFPIYQDKFSVSNSVNPYYFAENLKKLLPEDGICVVGNSCSCVVMKQCGVIEKNQRMWGNINCGTMGYDLPAAIGACIAADKKVICLAGDGSIQMNIQELQTVINYNLPIKIFIFNNNGYRSIVQSQGKSFGRLSGCTSESGMTLPDIRKIAKAYEIPYYRIENHNSMNDIMQVFLNSDEYGICEVIEDTSQGIEPKMANIILKDGSMISPSLDNLSPILDESVYKEYSTFMDD